MPSIIKKVCALLNWLKQRQDICALVTYLNFMSEPVRTVQSVVSTNMDAEALKFSDIEDEDEETFQLVERLASIIEEVSF